MDETCVWQCLDCHEKWKTPDLIAAGPRFMCPKCEGEVLIYAVSKFVLWMRERIRQPDRHRFFTHAQADVGPMDDIELAVEAIYNSGFVGGDAIEQAVLSDSHPAWRAAAVIREAYDRER